jgi:CheY-like chemotaxis protein
VSNALTVVLGWLDMAARAESLGDAQRAIAVALEHARRGRVIARRGIGARIESVQEARFASELALFAGRSIEPQARQRAVTVDVDVDPGTAQRIDGDGDALQILTNLLLNALQFSPAGTQVKLSVRRAGSSMVFCVSDHGPGVPAKIADELFEHGITTRAEGAGIGLPFSRRLARKNGGDLCLINPGQPGAQFELSWPCAPSSQVPPSRGNYHELKGARILMIEDDHSIAQLVEFSLEARGAQILAIVDPNALDDVLGSRPVFDLALVDLSPIKERTQEILTRLAHLAPHAPLVMMSGEPGGLSEELERHFTQFIRKPFDMDQLADTVNACLKQTKRQ